jgi:hypothetical protein
LQKSQMVRSNSLSCVGRPQSTQFDVRMFRITEVSAFKAGCIRYCDANDCRATAGSTNDVISFITIVLTFIA